MQFTREVENMYPVCMAKGEGATPIPQNGSYDVVKDVYQITGLSHASGTCTTSQGVLKMTLNVKNGIIQELLFETVGCSGMTHSAAIAAEILPGKTLIEAMNTHLVCDAFHVAMRELANNLIYGRSQSAFSKKGLAIGTCLEDLGPSVRSMVGTVYATVDKGPRYMEVNEGYVTRLALDKNDLIIGYEYINLGHMMNAISDGVEAGEAFEKAKGTFGRFEEGVKFINPRKE